jgi:hypothetical protein
MKGILILLGSGLVATTLAVAQDMPSSSNTDSAQSKQTQTRQTSSGVIRGCLSGSAGNYTITDQNGMQYTINGPDNNLQGSVGHEVEVTTSQDQSSQTSTQGDQTTASATNSVQVSNLHDLGSSCKPSSSMSNGPMTNDNGKGASPQQAPDAAAPQPPQTIAMLQEQQGPGANSPQQTSPPVTSQTPATPGATTNSAQQATSPSGSSATTGTNTTPAPTGSQADPTAPTATAPADQSTNPSTSAPSATPSSAQQPSANDQNKPLYERPATDIPGASSSGANSGSTPPQH